MVPERLAIIAVLLVAAAVMCVMFIATWRKRAMAGQAAVYLSLVMAAAAIYNFCYAMEVSGDTLDHVMFWVRLEHIGIEGLAPAWFLFALCVTGNERFITPKRIAMLLVVPVVLFVAAQTLGSLNLLHNNPRMDTGGLFPVFAYDRGVFNGIATVYYSLCLGASTVLFIGKLILGRPHLRAQAMIYCVSSVVPWIAAVAYNTGITFHHLDIVPLSLSVSGTLFAWGFHRYQLLDIIPLARDVVFDAMRDGVLVLDKYGRIIDFNRRMREAIPVLENKAIGQLVSSVLAAYPAILSLVGQDSSRGGTVQLTDTVTSRHYDVHLSPLVDGNEQMVGKIITIYDTTETKHLMERLESLARVDSLTGAYNRRHFVDMAMREVYRLQRYGGAVSLIMLDIDHFKDVNDSHGHGAGDAALRMTADVCRRILRQTDLLGRLGGDEFVILLPETDLASATVCAERLRSRLEQSSVQHEGRSFAVTASFGVASVIYPSAVGLEDLFRCADTAVYRAKQGGRNRVCAFACLEPEAKEPVEEKNRA